jgi:hypothetical protein
MAPQAPPATYPSQPILLDVEPTLFVTDFPRGLAFFTDKLAFKVAFTHGEPAFYGQVVRPDRLRPARRPTYCQRK